MINHNLKRSQNLYLFVALFFLVFASFSTSALAQSAPLRVAVDAPYPPFAYYDENKALTGFDVDIATALCIEMKRECEIKAVDFDQMIPDIVAGKLDLAVAGMAATEDRKKLVDFTERYFRSHSIFIEKPGAVATISSENLKNKRLGTQSGTIQEQYLKKMYGDVATIVLQTNYEDVFTDLKNDKTDLIFVDGLPGYHYLKSPEGDGLETIGEPIHSDIVLDSSAIAIAKGQDKLRKEVNQAIQGIRRNGEYDKINRKYFDFNVY